ncbi:MAG TPA: SLBB domain-containing protein, partial [Ferruginibacter sp.]|nr:SLBB domain-containing protein [Ferruginibacter sp.]
MQRTTRRIICRFICVSVILLSGFTAICQPPVQTPTEIAPGQLDPKSLSQPQLRSLLEDKNKQVGRDMNVELTKNTKIDKDSIIKDDIRRNIYSPKRTYGADIFSNASVTDLSELSTPPLDYPIGVGDHIVVSLWGGAEFQENYIVARDGAIFPSSLGKINVQGLTFENMRSVVYSRFRSVVPAGTNISISLGQPRSINVNVVGEVNSPGPQTVSAFSNAFNVIARAGGVTDFGNLRSIQVKRNGRVIDEIDVYQYLNTGDFGQHIYLQNNDFVIVGFVEKKVLATGQFKRPMFYQLKKDEGVKALIRYAGGLNSDALASGLKVIRTEDEKQVQRDVNANAILKITGQDFILLDGDIIKVDLIKPGISNKIEVRGEITYPDFYELRPGDRLFDVINRAGGVTRNTYLPRAYIFRGAGDSTNLQSDRLEVDL